MAERRGLCVPTFTLVASAAGDDATLMMEATAKLFVALLLSQRAAFRSIVSSDVTALSAQLLFTSDYYLMALSHNECNLQENSNIILSKWQDKPHISRLLFRSIIRRQQGPCKPELGN